VLLEQVSPGAHGLGSCPVCNELEQTGLDMAPEGLHASKHAVPSGCEVPEGPQHSWPTGQSPPKHVTEFAAVHVETSAHNSVGAAPAAGRTAQHI